MRNFEDLKSELLENTAIKAEYDALEPEYQVIRALIFSRKSQKLTQQQLSDRTGIDRADISKIENGNANPSLRTLKTLAAGMNMKVKIEFVPSSEALPPPQQ